MQSSSPLGRIRGCGMVLKVWSSPSSHPKPPNHSNRNTKLISLAGTHQHFMPCAHPMSGFSEYLSYPVPWSLRQSLTRFNSWPRLELHAIYPRLVGQANFGIKRALAAISAYFLCTHIALRVQKISAPARGQTSALKSLCKGDCVLS